MDLKALFKISHGMYITGTRGADNRLLGSCVDAVMVVEVNPAQIIVSLGKQSYTCENILKNKKFTLSVLSRNVSDEIIKTFGMQSSKTVNKWENMKYHLENDLPVLDEALSVMNLEVSNTLETLTHYVFLCNVSNLKDQNSGEPLTYAEYQARKTEPKAEIKKQWICKICGHVYDGKIPFEQLPAYWVCPICGASKSDFISEISNKI